MKEIINLEQKKILITGASSGIGREAAILASQLGAQVIILGRNRKRLDDVFTLLEGEGHQSVCYDLQNLQDIGDVMLKAIEHDGRKLDGLVHCAGIGSITPVRCLTYSRMDAEMRVNYYSFIEMVKHFSSKKISNGGSIVAISSIAATQGEKCQTIYSATKAALDASVRTLAQELSLKKIRVNSIRPGVIKTNMTENFTSAFGNDNIDQILDKQLLGIGSAEDVANMIVFLLSDASKFITGRSHYVDGGRF